MSDKAKDAGENKSSPKKTVFERIGWPVIALLIPLMVTTISAITFNAKSERDARLRLYSQLISQRENSESNLRIDMLNTLVGSFFESNSISLESADLDHVDAGVLQLELITYNFHESLQLSPLFHALNRRIAEIERQVETPEAREAVRDTRKRLMKLARKVIGKQVETLARYGAVDDYSLTLSDIRTGFHRRGVEDALKNVIDNINYDQDSILVDSGLARFAWNEETKQLIWDRLDDGITLDGREILTSVIDYPDTGAFDLAMSDSIPIRAAADEPGKTMEVYQVLRHQIDTTAVAFDPEPGNHRIDSLFSLQYDEGDSTHFIRGIVEITDLDTAEHELGIRLGLAPCVHAAGSGPHLHDECPAPPSDLENVGGFHVGVFDFPLIDNTRLKGDRRFSVFIKRWTDDDQIELGFAVFPGYVASLREKSYFKDVMERLRVD